jgi:hypothetical protein
MPLPAPQKLNVSIARLAINTFVFQREPSSSVIIVKQLQHHYGEETKEETQYATHVDYTLNFITFRDQSQ